MWFLSINENGKSLIVNNCFLKDQGRVRVFGFKSQLKFKIFKASKDFSLHYFPFQM